MGGVPTNYHAEVLMKKNGNTEVVVPGLMAAGEAACASVHGANRLGANSLLDLVVFGRSAAHRVADILKPNTPLPSIPDSAGLETIGNYDTLLHKNDNRLTSSDKVTTAQVRLKMQKTMQEHAAVFRTQDSLAKGLLLLVYIF